MSTRWWTQSLITAITQLDATGNVVRWCPGAQAVLGYSAPEVLDRPMTVFYTEEDFAAGLAERELAAARESGRYELEGWRVRKDGQRFRAGVALVPMKDETGAVTGFTQVIGDRDRRIPAGRNHVPWLAGVCSRARW